MYTLYHSPYTCSSAVLMVLEIIGAEHSVKLTDIQKGDNYTPEFLALNPQAKVPVLINEDKVMTQGQAILLYLSQQYPKAGLMPDLASEAGFEALKWLDFVASSLHFTFTKLFRAEQVGTDVETIRSNAESVVLKLLHQVEQRLEKSPFLAGEKPTLADYYLLVILGWDKVTSFSFSERFPVLEDYRTRVKMSAPQSMTLQNF